MTIKAIQTIYDNYRFRSRLEARWAVFFNRAGIEYRYEEEGFELPFGVKYLPDFHINDPDYGWCCAEIKPDEFSTEEYLKCIMLSMVVKQRVILFTGLPDYGSTYHMIRPCWGPEGDELCLTYLEVWGFRTYRPWYRDATMAACQARFEFGEKPK